MLCLCWPRHNQHVLHSGTSVLRFSWNVMVVLAQAYQHLLWPGHVSIDMLFLSWPNIYQHALCRQWGTTCSYLCLVQPTCQLVFQCGHDLLIFFCVGMFGPGLCLRKVASLTFFVLQYYASQGECTFDFSPETSPTAHANRQIITSHSTEKVWQTLIFNDFPRSQIQLMRSQLRSQLQNPFGLLCS